MIRKARLTINAKVTDEEIKIFKEFLKVGGQESGAAMENIAQMELNARTESSRVGIERQKKEFARNARTRNEKKLDLAEAFNRYQLEAR